MSTSSCNDDNIDDLRPSSYNLEDESTEEADNQATSSNFEKNNFARLRRRMSSGLVLSYNFLTGSAKRRDST